MRRKRIIAKLLALSLVFSGLPMTSLQAAELPAAVETQEGEAEENPADDSQAEVENQETESTDHSDSAEQEKETQDGDNAADDTKQDASDESGTEQKEEETDSEKDENLENDGADQNASETDGTNLNGFVQAGILNEDGKTDLHTAAGALEGGEIAKDVKMAGSDGILYDDVVYLSAKNVMAMDIEQQELYTQLCDEVAASRAEGTDLQNVVFAVNADGDLYMSYYVPGVVLEEIKEDMQSAAAETLMTAAEEEQKNDETTDENQNTAQDEKRDDDPADENKDQDATQDEKSDDKPADENKDQDAAQDEKSDDKPADESRDQAEDEKKDDDPADENKDQDAAQEEKKDDETTDENQDAAEEKDDEVSDGDKDDAEKEAEKLSDPAQDTAEEPEQAEEEIVLEEENMDALPQMEEETFEAIESVRVESTIDLGYGAVSDENGMNGIQFNSVLPKSDYFTSQLDSKQRQYYNLAKGKLISGSNSFSFSDNRFTFNAKNVAHALSALILTYPDKTDWMAKPGGFTYRGWYRLGSSTANITVTVEKSKYYSGSLDSKAKSKVQTIANQAMQYAADSYKNTPVYGVVKYFDQWVCANGYYDMRGTENGRKDKVYYNCHSAYGILLEGYGVCESYAKTMSRLLDAIGIPNLYVVGDAGGGHAWNYVQMPNGSWYMVDSTWNDATNISHTQSSGTYLLVPNDGQHKALGNSWRGEPAFNFVSLAAAKYAPSGSTESVSINKKECNLLPKKKEKLIGKINGKEQYGKTKTVWSSSNTKVATVNSKGEVTAKAAGTTTITFAAAGMTAKCTVNVDQIKSVKVKETQKTSETLSFGIEGTKKAEKNIVLTVDMGASPHTAEWMIKNQKVDAPKVTQPTKGSGVGVATAAPTVAKNEITVKVAALKEGKVNLPLKFGGKTVTFKVTAGKVITEEMFDITWPAAVTETKGKRTTPYTGKAIKPGVKKKAGDEYKAVTFSKTYVNNKNAGTAKLVIRGTGKYGGTIEIPYTITPVDITGADFSKALKSKAYNGGSNPPSTTVKLGKKTLKAGTDYEILYNGSANAGVLPAGTYTITIRGKGNYTGKVAAQQTYQVTPNTIAKVTVSGSGSVKYTGNKVNPYTVKIGKNVLPASDYTLTWYSGQGKSKKLRSGGAPTAKGKYTAVVTIKGKNLTTTAKKTEIEKKLTIK